MVTCCQHVGDAANTGEHLSARIAIDDWGAACVVCTGCFAQIEANTRHPANPQVGFYHVLDAPIVPYCDPCLSEWYAASGQGDFFAEYTRLRRRLTPYTGPRT